MVPPASHAPHHPPVPVKNRMGMPGTAMGGISHRAIAAQQAIRWVTAAVSLVSTKRTTLQAPPTPRTPECSCALSHVSPRCASQTPLSQTPAAVQWPHWETNQTPTRRQADVALFLQHWCCRSFCNLAGSGGGRGGPADPQEVPIVAASKLVAVARDHELMSLAAALLANCTNAEQAGPRGDRGGGEDCGISRCGATELDDEGG